MKLYLSTIIDTNQTNCPPGDGCPNDCLIVRRVYNFEPDAHECMRGDVVFVLADTFRSNIMSIMATVPMEGKSHFLLTC